ncbi:hypothetical protein [Roseibacillus ishigakijimensis]|uniref:Uncharacterized protein n=1 Tax=Roseibacillus ishigakijimensis TaxID=454146 RepID=A0A934RMD2_9BACT|nr:hypothetical protein [Roseibacillus ishigakijimensis]MBK1833455.1 hypothetical protein [Roseibacillus ishigakijimensis]
MSDIFFDLFHSRVSDSLAAVRHFRSEKLNAQHANERTGIKASRRCLYCGAELKSEHIVEG